MGILFDFVDLLLKVAVLFESGTVLIQPVAGLLNSPGFVIPLVCIVATGVEAPKSKSIEKLTLLMTLKYIPPIYLAYLRHRWLLSTFYLNR